MGKTYLHTLYPNLTPQIDEALNNGYSLQEVHDFIGGKVNEAKRGGYSDDEIQQYTGSPANTPHGYNPFLAQTYQAASALNKGLLSFTKGMIEPGQYISEKLGFGRSKVFDQIVENASSLYKSNSAYWEDKAKESGAGFLDELIGEAIGGALPGITEFALNAPYAAAQGALEARSEGQNELVGAMTGAVKRGILGKLFHTYGQLSQPLKAAAMGGTMAVETAASGGTAKEVAKAGGTGVIYSVGGKGRIGIREIKDGVTGQSKYEVVVRSDKDIQEAEAKEQLEVTKNEQKAQGGKGSTGQEVESSGLTGIAKVESGGSYTAEHSTTKAYGKYQIMPDNWAPWAKEAGLPEGSKPTPENQEKVAQFKWGQYVEQFGSDQLASVAWFAGPGAAKKLMNGDRGILNRKDANGVTVEEYVKKTTGREYSETYDTFIKNAVGGAKARRETLLEGKLSDQAKRIKSKIEEVEALTEDDLQRAFREGDLDRMGEHAARFDRPSDFAEAVGSRRGDPEGKWKDLGFTSATDFFNQAKRTNPKRIEEDLSGFISEESGMEIEDIPEWMKTGQGNQTKIRTIIGGMDKDIDEMVRTADAMSRAAYASGDKAGALREHLKMREIQARRDEILRNKKSLRKEVDTTLKRIRNIQKAKNIDPDFMEQIENILDGYDLRVRSDKVLARREATRDFISRMKEQGEEVFISEDKLDKIRQTAVNDMTLDELRNLKEVVQQLAHQGALKKKLLTAKGRRDFAQAKAELITSIDEKARAPEPVSEGTLTPSQRKKGPVTQFVETFEKLHNINVKVEYLCKKLDGYKDWGFGKAYRRIFNPIVQGENAYLTRAFKIADDLKQALSLLGPEYSDRMKEVVILKDGTKLNREETVMTYLNSKSKGNLKRLEEGYGWKPEKIAEIISHLSKEDISYGDRVLELVGENFNDIAKVLKRLTGEKLKREEGYFPIWVDRELSEMADKRQLEQDLMKEIYSKVKVERGFTLSRVGGTDAPLLSFKVIPFHLEKVNQFLSYAEAVRDVQKVILDPDIKASIVRSTGQAAYDQIMPWLKDVANPRSGYLGQWDKIVGIARNNASVAILGFKLSTAIMQPLAYTQLINRIGMADSMRGLREFYKDPWAMTSRIYEASPSMRARKFSFDRDLKYFMDTEGRGTMLSKFENIRQASYWMIQMMDLAVTLPAWESAYIKGIREMGSETRAVEYADMIVRTTQSSGMAKDLAQIQRGSNFQKLFTTFYTYFASTYNEHALDIEMYRAGEANIGDVVRSFMWLFVIPPAVQALVKSREDTEWKDMARETVQGVGAAIPIVGPMVSAATLGNDYTPSPAFEFPKEAIRAMNAKSGETFLKHSAMATGYLFGLPSRQAVLTAQYLGDILEDRSYDPSNLVYRKKEKKGDKW